MSDPIEMLEQLDPNAPVQVAAVSAVPATVAGNQAADLLPAGSVAISAEELARLQQSSQAFEQAAPFLQQLQAERLQRQAPPVPTTEPTTDEQFWQSPTAATQKIIQEQVNPYAQRMAAQLGSMVINTFKSGKGTDRFFGATVPHFERRVAEVDKTWLGSLAPAEQTKFLEVLWDAAKGSMLTESEKKNPPKAAPPPNIGGGGGTSAATGGGAKRTLEQIDPMTYRMAVQKGWSQEKMDAFTAELLTEMES